ncbi:hypothetical protein TNCV_1329741 [Trichonephila clavipes]|nr:hypothetical protein TNCV_1329741 [Trichonephila clavipes]
MVLKANDRRTSCPCHDEFRGPRSDYVRQGSLTLINQTISKYERNIVYTHSLPDLNRHLTLPAATGSFAAWEEGLPEDETQTISGSGGGGHRKRGRRSVRQV